MACHWRIRHKLLLGFGLVVGIMALLLTGTVKGLQAYSATMKSIDSKLAELSKAEEFKSTVAVLDKPEHDPEGLRDPLGWLKGKSADAQAKLATYVEQLQDTLNRGRDPNQGEMELELIGALRQKFAQLESTRRRRAEGALVVSEGPVVLRKVYPEVAAVIDALQRDADQLCGTLYDDLNDRLQEARRHYRTCMTFVLATSGLGVLLLISLTRLVYRWVLDPIRKLGQGVGRLAQGNFEGTIELRSGDEMEDLARAFNDMTARLRDMYRDLARQVEERSRQLVRSERLASVGFLAAGVAHEINNPLASIAFCGEALESRLGDALAAAPGDHDIIFKYLKMIQQEAFRCKEITQRLLETSRGSDRREPTDLAELIQSVLDVVQHLQNCKGKRIAFDPPGRVLAWVNPQEIRQVVLNLVVNALDSMDDGGTLTVTLREAPGPGAGRGGLVEMVFADTGCGMTADILDNIFEPFFTRSRTGRGTGLGLSISHQVISQHGGEIAAASPGLGKGSTFTVRLPLQPAESVKEGGVRGHVAA